MTLYTKQPKPKTCVCGEKFIPRGIQSHCTPKCKLSYRNGSKKENLEQFSLKELFLMARGVFQKYIKLRDKGKPCITSGFPFKKGEVINAGHLFAVEKYPGLCFNEDNCHAQNQVWNFRMDNQTFWDKTAAMVDGRIGPERFGELIAASKMPVYRNYKYSKPELIEIIHKYQNKIEGFK